MVNMFDRKKYKKFAKMQLKGRMNVPLLMTLISVVISFIITIPLIKTQFSIIQNAILLSQQEMLDYVTKATKEINASTFFSILSWVRIIFAQISVYLKMSRSPAPVSMNDFFAGFNLWTRALLAALWQYIYVFLWSLLFLIPGIIKAFAYSQTNFLVAEFSSLSVPEAITISKKITRGYKWNLFVLELSFIGLYLLCCLTLGIAYFWIAPYINMTRTNAYHAILKNGLEENIISMKELGCNNGEEN